MNYSGEQQEGRFEGTAVIDSKDANSNSAYHDLKLVINEYRQEIQTLKQHLTEQTNHYQKMMIEMGARLEHAQSVNVNLQSLYHGVLTSRSYRITAPLRAFVYVARRFLRFLKK